MGKYNTAWLSYRMKALTNEAIWSRVTLVTNGQETPATATTAVDEICRAAKELFGKEPVVEEKKITAGCKKDASVTELKSNAGCTKGIALVLVTELAAELAEGYRIVSEDEVLFVIAGTGNGLLYGAFDVIRTEVVTDRVSGLSKTCIPDNPLRMMNHWDNLDGSIERGYSGQSFFFVENEVDKRSRLYKAVKEKGYICELNEQSDQDIMRWVLSVLKRYNKLMSSQTLQLFLTKTGSSMENISKELEKLICYTMGRDEITAQDVEAVCVTQITNRIFDMITAMSQKNQDKALALYYDLLTLKEPPMRIMYLIARNFNQLLMVKELTENGNASSAIATKMGIQSFLVGKLQGQARVFRASTLRRAIE